MNRFCIDYYEGRWDEIRDDEYGFVRHSDLISEYFDDESEFSYRLHELESHDDKYEIDEVYRVELMPYEGGY